jgi:mannose-1-phosphate guanylyltransferase/mannose-1-phosphate guanylyltransferase/phosphomannomutase
MRVMIMAAGLGTRLRPLTEHLPKPVAPVGNRPCVDYLLRRIAGAGCTGAIMNLHYHPQTIIDTIGDGSAYGIAVEYSIEEELLGTAGGTRKCQAFLTADDDVFLVTSGDGLHTIDLAALAAAHRASGALATITVKRVEDITGFGVVVTDDDGRITSFQEKPAPEDALSDLVNVGVYCFNAAIFEEIPAEGQSDIGSLDELLATNLAIASGAVDVDPAGDLIMDSDCGLPNVSPDSVIAGPVLIGEGAEVHSGATIIGPAVIGPRAVIEQGAVVEHALVLPEAEIHADSPATGILGDVENLDAVWQR